MVDGDADLLHPGEHVDQRQLHVGEQAGAATAVELVVEGGREVEHRARVQHRGLAAGVVVETVQAQLTVVGAALLQLALEVAHRQVGEVVGALVRPGEVRRERGVAAETGQRPSARRQGEHRALRVVQHLRLVGVTEPGHDRRVVLGRDLLDDHVGGRAVGRGERQRLHVARARAPGTLDVHARPACPSLGVVGQPAADLARREPGHVEGEAGVVDVLLGLEGLEEPVAEHPELQAVEQRVHLLAVPRLHREVGRLQRQVEVVDQRVELAVADHVVEVLAQALPRLALDLLGLVDDVLEAVVGQDPLGGRLGADAGHAGQVVGGLTDQRRQLGVASRRHAVLLLDGRRGHPLHLRDAAHRVDHGGAVVDQLEGVAVAGADQDRRSRRPAPGWRGCR